MRAKKLEPNNPEILLGFGRVCLKMDLLDERGARTGQAAGMRPDDPTYQYTLAAAKVGKRQFEAAQDLLEGLVKKKPKDPQLQYALGSVFYLQGRLTEAAVASRESVRLLPEQLASYYYLALVARDQGQTPKRSKAAGACFGRIPITRCRARPWVDYSWAPNGTPMRRATWGKRSLNPKSVKANYQLGLLLARMGKKKRRTTAGDSEVACVGKTKPRRACNFACWIPINESYPDDRSKGALLLVLIIACSVTPRNGRKRRQVCRR